MPALPLVLVLVSGMMHAVWSMLAKQSEDKHTFLWAIYTPITLLLLPLLAVELTRASFNGTEWLLIGLSLVIQGIYALLLAYTYQHGDLSQVYPIMRGSSTLLIPLFGVLLLGDSLPLWSWLGIGCMLVGFLMMGAKQKGQRWTRATLTPVLLALSVGLCTTAYTLVDKINLGHLSPLALLELGNIGFVLGLTPSMLRARKLKQVVKRHPLLIAIGALLSPGSYLLFLFAARSSEISTVAPLREVGIVFGTLLGLFVLKESQGARRLTASVAVVTGIILIAVSGHP